MLKTLPGLIPKESPIAKKLLQTVTLVCSNNSKCKVTPLFQQDLGGGQQSQSIQGPRWALCTASRIAWGGEHPQPSPGRRKRGGKRDSPKPALTLHLLKQQMSTGGKMAQAGLSVPQRGPDLFSIKWSLIALKIS